MTVAHNRRLKVIQFAIDAGGGPQSFECQVSQWMINNNTDDGDKLFTFCPDGEFREESDDDYSLELTFFSDWRSGGISDFLTANNGLTVDFTLDHHPDIPAEHVKWTGKVKIKAPSVGGEVRNTETNQVTFPIIGKPAYARVGA